jgi:hypothetical protein
MSMTVVSLAIAGMWLGALRAKPKLDEQCIPSWANHGDDALSVNAP